MKLLCVAQFVIDGDWMNPVGQNRVAINDTCRMKPGPGDAAAIGFALKMKEQISDLVVEVLALATPALIPQLQDILRVGVDRATLLSDNRFKGCDIVTQARILGRYILSAEYDWILTGSHASGGEAAALAPALAEILGIDYLAHVCLADESSFARQNARLDVREGRFATSYEVSSPAILGFDMRSGYQLPHARLKRRKQDVSDRLFCLSSKDLKLDDEEIGLEEPLTSLVELTKRVKQRGSPIVTDLDDEGIELVYHFLKENRLI